MALLDPFGRELPEPELRATYKDREDRLWQEWGCERSTAGEVVSHKSAMTVMAFFACVRNISEDIAKLPKRIRQNLKRGSEPVPDHPAQFILDEPNENTDCHSFWQTLVAHALVHHGGFAEVIYNGAGVPVALELLDPTSVQVLRSRTNEVAYKVRGMDDSTALPARYVIHLHGLGHDGVTGYDVPSIARQLLGAAQGLQKYRGSFYGNGATPTGVLEHPGTLTKEAQERLREVFSERYAGSQNAHKAMVLEEGMKWTAVSIDPERAQMEAATNIAVEDICRIYRMPPHKIGHLARATNNNIEHQGLEYDRDCLDPWCDKLRRELERKLFTQVERRAGLKVYINLKGVLRGDLAARTAHYKELFYMSAITPNEIRELEDMNPYKGGDEYYVQQNLVPVKRLDEIIDKQVSTPAPAQQAPTQTEAKATPAFDSVRASYERILICNIERILTVEADKAKRGKITKDMWEKYPAFIAAQVQEQIAAIAIGLNRELSAHEFAVQYGKKHYAKSRADIDASDLTSWHNGERAYEAARQILQAIYDAPEKDLSRCSHFAA